MSDTQKIVIGLIIAILGVILGVYIFPLNLVLSLGGGWMIGRGLAGKYPPKLFY